MASLWTGLMSLMSIQFTVFGLTLTFLQLQVGIFVFIIVTGFIQGLFES